MQRSQRRFLCSTASAPSRSITTLRPRRRSTASSVAGDSAVATRESKKSGKESKAKARPVKLRTATQKSGHKAPLPPSKTLRPSPGVLHNAIVLAPFYTLKRCFQNKLVDLYSIEKMKKINRKMNMAEKQKMSFQYDIVELNQLSVPVKKETKRLKERQKLRSPSYCQCDRSAKADLKEASNSQKPEEPNQTLPPNSASLPGHSDTKRRRLTPNILKAELSPRNNLCSPNSFFPSDTNFSSSRVSSRSKSDTLDTDSNSRSCRDEHLTGSLAISTTSFDSCLEHFEKYPRVLQRAKKRSRCQTSTLNNFLPETNVNRSRHLIMHVGSKNSDTRIEEFIDREPQTQLISHKSAVHLQPLPHRRSKSRSNKPENATTGYFLRSLTPDKVRAEQIEVAIQVEGSGAAEGTKQGCSSQQETASEQKARSEEAGEVCDGRGQSEGPSEKAAPFVGLEPDIIQGPSESGPFELLGNLDSRFEEEPVGLEEPQDKDSEFIFGPRNTASSLGESCKFSFGLNFVFSDDED